MSATVSPTAAAAPPKALHLSLLAVQVLLGAAFTMAGLWKTFTPVAELAQALPWVPGSPEALVRFIGVSELAGGLGLVLPAATRIKPVLTAWAGVGLATVMVLAAGFHVVRGELSALPVNVVLGGLAAFVAWGRFGKASIAPR